MDNVLYDSCKAMGIVLSDKQQKQFMDYQKLLLQWNEKMNLTAITTPRDVALKHFADSISIGAQCVDFENKTVIDVGTGAGFPGIPLKIAYSSLQVTLLDSLQKRITFLDTVIDALSLEGIKAIHMRAEDGGQSPELREQFDYAVSRAVAPLCILAEYCLPFVKQGGMFLSLKGPDVSEELEEAKAAIDTLGGEVLFVKPVEIPFSDLHHSLVMIQKIRQTPIRFPRKAGKAIKNPIK